MSTGASYDATTGEVQDAPRCEAISAGPHPLRCELPAGHKGRHAWTSAPEDEDDGRAHMYQWGRGRRELTPEERAVVEERRTRKARMLAALEALSPSLVAPGDPPLRHNGPALRDVSEAREAPPLLRLARTSGTGGSGTALLLHGRHYDGGNGNAAGPYVLACVEFHDGAGYRVRTQGVALRGPELRDVARALAQYADALDAADAPPSTPAKDGA